MSEEIKQEVSRGDAERAEVDAAVRRAFDPDHLPGPMVIFEDNQLLAAEVRRLRQEVNGLSGEIDTTHFANFEELKELRAEMAGFDPRVTLPEEGAGMVVIEILTAPMIVPNGITVAHLRYGGDSFYESFANGRVIPVEKVVRWWHLPTPSNATAPEVSP